MSYPGIHPGAHRDTRVHGYHTRVYTRVHDCHTRVHSRVYTLVLKPILVIVTTVPLALAAVVRCIYVCKSMQNTYYRRTIGRKQPLPSYISISTSSQKLLPPRKALKKKKTFKTESTLLQSGKQPRMHLHFFFLLSKNLQTKSNQSTNQSTETNQPSHTTTNTNSKSK